MTKQETGGKLAKIRDFKFVNHQHMFMLNFSMFLLAPTVFILLSLIERTLFTSSFSPAGFTISCGYSSRMLDRFGNP